MLCKRGRLLDDRVGKTCVQHIICTYQGVTVMYVCDDDDDDDDDDDYDDCRTS